MAIYKAIETRFLGPTNFQGARIKAKCWGGSMTIPYPHEFNLAKAHREAAMALIDKMDQPYGGWRGDWVQGSNAKGDGYVFVKTKEGN